MDAEHEQALVAVRQFAWPHVLESAQIVTGLEHADAVVAVKEAVEALLLVDEVADGAGIEHHEQERLVLRPQGPLTEREQGRFAADFCYAREPRMVLATDTINFDDTGLQVTSSFGVEFVKNNHALYAHLVECVADTADAHAG